MAIRVDNNTKQNILKNQVFFSRSGKLSLKIGVLSNIRNALNYL